MMRNLTLANGQSDANGKEMQRHTTREQLFLAAERLYAEQGIGAVSMRAINSAAKQKNVSALHYHFGSREAIIEAIFDYRMAAAGRQRKLLLDELFANGLQDDLRSLVHVAIWPMAEQLMAEQKPNYFVRFLAQAHRLPQFDSWLLVRHRNRHSIVKVYLMILRLLDELPRPIVHTRTIVGLRHAIYMLADLDRLIDERHPEARNEMVAFYTNDLIDMVTAELRAEMSPATKKAYEKLAPSRSGASAALFGLDALHTHQRTRALGDPSH